MPSDSGLTAAGSSTYASNTLHVGDGTWDSDRDTFLLPNLMGLNFETMKYNGMGNRFRDMPDYHKMIIAHGILGAIAFLGLVPTSLMLIRYYSRWNPFWAFKLHVWCQVLTLFLSTIVFVLGWFAVGPKRSLSNPHHGMGLAIYVVVIFQFFWGYFVHKVERNRKTFHVPLKLVIHRWMGFTLALMGIVQIPLGLTLYGSPKVLFVLFAIAVFTLLVVFFVLSYLYDNEGYPMGSDYDSRPSYVSGPSSAEEQHHHGGIRKWAGAALAGAALAKLFRRRSHGGGENHSYSDSRSSYMDEKYSDEESHHGGWKKKLLEVGALGGAAYFAKRLFDKKRNRDDDDTESGTYSRAHTRSDSMSEEMLGRMEDGRRPEPTHRTPLNRPPSRPPSRPQSPGSSYYNSTYMSHNDPKPSAGNALFGAGALAAMKNLFTGRKGNAEQRRVEEMRRQEIEDEKMARANSKRYTGDGRYPPNRGDGSNTITDVMSTESSRPPHGESTISPTPGRYGGYQDPPPLSSVHDDMPSRPSGSVPSSPVSSERRHTASTLNSIELKKHKDGHNVTLRRLTEEEAAANREARRRERRNSRRRNSASSFSGNEADSQDRWRRVEELERQQQEQMEREQEEAADGAPSSLPPQSTYSYAPPPPPPPPQQPPSRFGNYGRPSAPPQHQPPSTNPYGSGSILSPDTFTGTEASGDYAGNRRRRRAERARARQERQQSVDFA